MFTSNWPDTATGPTNFTVHIYTNQTPTTTVCTNYIENSYTSAPAEEAPPPPSWSKFWLTRTIAAQPAPAWRTFDPQHYLRLETRKRFAQKFSSECWRI